VSEPSKYILMQEIGYPSGYEPQSGDGSSVTLQAQFVATFYNATLPYLSRFSQLNWFWLVDEEYTNPYSITVPQFVEYLYTLGLIQADGSAKPALAQLEASWLALRTATAAPAPPPPPPPPPSSTTNSPSSSSAAALSLAVTVSVALGFINAVIQ